MSKTKRDARARRMGADAKPGPAAEKERGQQGRNLRETIESIAIAFILAFLFRTFEAEAFVIPTGSMAPTLQGYHKDVECPQCGYRYRASASSEQEPGVQDITNREIVACTCPICRFTMPVDPRPNPAAAKDPLVQNGANQPSYNGCRILVGKFVYEFAEPQRWDVIVFKYPGDAKMNYIKRLVGLPDEEVQIRYGDIFVRPLDSNEEFEIVRKPPEKARSMMQMVHDNDYLPSVLVKNNWPLRWQVSPAVEGGWTETLEDQGLTARQTFLTAGKAAEDAWIRYQHLVPSWSDWQAILNGPLRPSHQVKRQLITDFYAYNTFQTRGEHRGNRGPNYDKLGLHWVGDLMVQCDVEVKSGRGEILLDLVEGGLHFGCRVDVATGDATLSIAGQDDFGSTAKTDVRGPGAYHLAFANVDDQLLLWVDGELVPFDVGSNVYRQPHQIRPHSTDEDPGDLAPVGVGSRGAALVVTGLKVLRDIYYIADEAAQRERPITDYPEDAYPLVDHTPEDLANFLSDPDRWDTFRQRRQVQFELDRDQFFVLGDNSPMSKDGRLWGDERLDSHVDRELLIGKALCIYWPHSWNRVPGTRIPLPFFPNFADMGLVR